MRVTPVSMAVEVHKKESRTRGVIISHGTRTLARVMQSSRTGLTLSHETHHLPRTYLSLVAQTPRHMETVCTVLDLGNKNSNPTDACDGIFVMSCSQLQ